MYEETHLEICYGPMKSGKSRYLVQKAEALYAAGIPFLAFKPRQDTRDGCFIRSRDSVCRDIQAVGIDTAAEILPLLQGLPITLICEAQQDALNLLDYLPPGRRPQACLIDEVFLLDSGLLSVMRQLSERQISVYLSGLDRDFRREFFPLRDHAQAGVTMQAVIEICQTHLPLYAHCEACGADAPFTQRLVNGQPAHYNSPTVLIGDEEYQPRCKAHHEVIGHPQFSLAS
ncbi:MAG: thymidine kinase [Candidatus Sericytochromatia bacterium]